MGAVVPGPVGAGGGPRAERVVGRRGEPAGHYGTAGGAGPLSDRLSAVTLWRAMLAVGLAGWYVEKDGGRA